MTNKEIKSKARAEGWKIGQPVGYLNGTPLHRMTGPDGHSTKLTIPELGRILYGLGG